ncbi:MAG TPA: histidine kinase dimerization/phosphoacceptor domain-containing protein, partial [Streptosporangiaceae bacterium]|nr:histidine kinase dimerization/phosphoacceptor domain-containing protein [Streptosporangiaceae bacterium]
MPSSLPRERLIVLGATVDLLGSAARNRGWPDSTHGWTVGRAHFHPRARYGHGIWPYRGEVDSKADVTAGVTAGEAKPRPPPDGGRATYLRLRLLAVAAVAFVVITSIQARHAPGRHGAAFLVTVILIAFCAATVGAMRRAQARPAVQLAVLLVAVASAAALVGLQANRAAFVGVFPAVSVAALTLPVVLSTVVAGTAICAVSAAWLANGSSSLSGIVLNDFAIVAFFVLSMFATRLQESNQRAQALLAELEQTRAAQANAAALAERQRLAREMHDVLAHSLSGLMLNLEGARLLARQ